MTKQHCTLVLSVAVVVGLLLLAGAMSVDALAAKGNNNAELRSDKPTVLWNTTVGRSVWNAPTYDATRNWVYANGATEVAILDARSGTKIRNVSTTSDVFGRGDVGISNIVLAGNKILFTGGHAAVSQDATTLAMNWNFTAPQAFENPPTYVPSKNALFAGSYWEQVFYRINSLTGALVWKATQFVNFGQGIQAQSTFSMKHNVIIMPLKYFFVVALNGDTGSKVWSQPTSNDCAPGILSENEDMIFYASASEALYAFGTASGKINWQFNVSGGNQVAPLLHNGALFVKGGFACYSVDANTGKQIWANANCAKDDSYGLGFARLYGDTFLVPSHNGFAAIALNGSGVVWSWSGASGDVFIIPPPTSDGKLFVGDRHGIVFALQLPPSGTTRGGIVEKRCVDTACSSGCVTQSYKSGQCLQTGASSSILRTCTLSGDAVLVKTFPQSSTCNANSAHSDVQYNVKKCYEDTFGGSNELVSCSA